MELRPFTPSGPWYLYPQTLSNRLKNSLKRIGLFYLLLKVLGRNNSIKPTDLAAWLVLVGSNKSDTKSIEIHHLLNMLQIENAVQTTLYELAQEDVRQQLSRTDCLGLATIITLPS